MRSFFNPENSLWQLLGYIGDTVMLSLLWFLCSLPLVTCGAATAALYDTVVSNFRRAESGYLGRFLSTFKRELVNSLLPTLLWGGLLALLLWLLRRFTVVAQGSAAVVAAVAFLVLLLVPLGCACWTFPLLSRFTLRFGRLLGNAVRLSLGYLPRTLLIAAATAGCLYVTLQLLLLPVFILPALLALFWSLLMEPVFQKYEGK
jgi:uncharacterized membrane protein YesL